MSTIATATEPPDGAKSVQDDSQDDRQQDDRQQDDRQQDDRLQDDASPHEREAGARPSEVPFVTTLTVADEELHPLTFARVTAPDAPPSLRPGTPRPAVADVTLTLRDEELHPVTLDRQWSQWAELVPAMSPSPPALPPRIAPLPLPLPLPSDEADPLLGRVIANKYKLLALLSRGGMGLVYEVEHLATGERMAMKLLSGKLASDPQIAARFRQEAKATSRLTHPNTVKVYDFGESDQLVFLVMEYLKGRDLASLIRAEGALPFARIAPIALQICASISEAHEQGIIHRDIKPENIFVLATSEGADLVKVLDFGIAQVREPEAASADSAATDAALAKALPIQGTPYYMAPEQIRGERIDARADVYALGALLYKALTGVAPFMADTPAQVLDMHLHEPLVSMRERVPGLVLADAVESVIARALNKEPAQRQSSMHELAQELTACLGTATKPQKKRSPSSAKKTSSSAKKTPSPAKKAPSSVKKTARSAQGSAPAASPRPSATKKNSRKKKVQP